MNKKKRVLIIITLLLAASAAAFGVYKSEQARISEKANPAGTEAVTAEEAGDAEAGGRAEATEPLATVFFASDYQLEPGLTEPADNLSGILSAAKADGKDVKKAVMCGDYTNDPKLYDYQISPDDSIEEARGVISSVYPEIGTGDMMFVQGNHDRMTDRITASGLHEEGDYLIYVLNTEEDFPWKQGKTAGSLAKVRKSSAEMKECFDGLIEKGETRPVFIAGHVPLHFTARTSSRHGSGDNLYSSLIFDVVNEAADSLDIVYLYGHNHSKGWDCYMGGSSVFKAPGDSLLIPEFEESDITTDKYREETLKFTYMNAGYTGYYMNCGPEEYEAGERESYNAADVTLTGTVLEIYPDRITATRYDADGRHVLGHAGEADPYKGGIDAGLIGEEHYSTETPGPREIRRKSF